MSIFDTPSQILTTAPLWIQTPVVLIVAVPLCAALALGWLRLIDVLGARLLRAKRWAEAKVMKHADE